MTCYRAALAQYRLGSDQGGEALALMLIGAGWDDLGEPDSAFAHYRQALAIQVATNDQNGAARTLGNIGIVFDETGKPDSALAYYTRALAIHRGEGNQAAIAATLANIGVVYNSIGKPDSALGYYRESLTRRRALGDRRGEAGALHNIGLAFANLGQPDSALSYYRSSLSIKRTLGNAAFEAATINNIGFIYARIGRPDSALAYYRQALLKARDSGDRPGVARTLGNIGEVFHNTSQPDSALSYYHQSLSLHRAVGNRPGEAGTLGNLGGVFFDIGQMDSAVAYFRQALSIERETGDRTNEASSLANIGTVFAAMENPDSALAYLSVAVSIHRSTGNRSDEAITLGSIGKVFADSRREDSALSYFRRALELKRAVQDRAGEAVTLGDIGETFAARGRMDSALTYHREAVVIQEEVRDRAGEARTLASIGETLYRIGRPDSAVEYFDRATAMLAGISLRTGSEFNQLSFNETATRWYGTWTLAWLARSRSHAAASSSWSVASDIAAAGGLAASERGRAQALLALMRDTAVQIMPGANLPAEGVHLVSALQRSGSVGLIYFLTADTLVTWLIPTRGPEAVFRQAISRNTLGALVAAWQNALGVDGGARLALRDAPLTPAATASENALRTRSDPGADLARIVLPAAIQSRLVSAKELVIVPQGPLALIPFAALPFGARQQPLGTRFALRYATSLATLEAAESRPTLIRGPGHPSVLSQSLVVGNPLMPEVPLASGGTAKLGPLPGAETEARQIAAALGAPVLNGAAASETTVLSRIRTAPVIHLASHGFAYSSQAGARNSFLALASDDRNDGLLTVAEVLDNPAVRLQAELVVLSACQTGLGNLREAEGTVGLQRAFLAKGARSLLVSLWSVSDLATAALMDSFYRHWLRDADVPSKAEALRRAQEDVRRTPGWGDPRYWAGFQLVGAR